MDPNSQRRLSVLQQHFDYTLRRPEQKIAISSLPFDVRELQQLLDHDNHNMRAAVKEFMKNEIYLP